MVTGYRVVSPSFPYGSAGVAHPYKNEKCKSPCSQYQTVP